jgi:hypothetical protein
MGVLAHTFDKLFDLGIPSGSINTSRRGQGVQESFSRLGGSDLYNYGHARCSLHNPRRHDRVARMVGFNQDHPGVL